MNKKLTPLENLKILEEQFGSKKIYICANSSNKEYLYKDLYFKPIEIALKDYELLKERTRLDSFECLLRLELILPRGKELLIPVAKQLKALEIIKEKRVDTYFLMQTDTLEEYNKSLHTCSWFPSYELTQEEYDLLKEVLK